MASDMLPIDDEKLCDGLLDPSQYLSAPTSQASRWKDQLSQLYDHIVSVSSSDAALRKQILLPKLLVGSFDDEQIWQQIELINGVLVRNIEGEIEKRLVMAEEVTAPVPPVPEEEDQSDNEGDGIEGEEDIDDGEEGEEGEDDIEEGDEDQKAMNLGDMDKFCEAMEKDAFNDDKEEDDSEEDEEMEGANIFLDNAGEGDEGDLSEEESKLEKELKKVGVGKFIFTSSI
eukprot:sb/3469509/